MKRILICILCVALLCGCSVKTQNNEQKLTIVTTIFPLYDFARAIGGDNVEVKMLIKPGSEVHSYDPVPSDMLSLYDSDLFLYIGGESDKWVQTLLDGSKLNSVSLIECVSHHHEEKHKDHNHTDEHIWTSPENAVLMLDAICESMIKIDTANEKVYRENCDKYVAQIKNASCEIEKVVSEKENPFILVADRFPFLYLTEQYGIKYEAAFDGCAVSTDISMKTMSRLTKTIEENKLKTVFCTELSSQNIARALNEESDVEIIELHSAHNVTLDDFNSGVTYVDILYRNKSALERGLCSGAY